MSGPGPAGPAPGRTRVVLAEVAARGAAARPPVAETLVRGLVRAQLALALRLALVVAVGLGGLPLLFAAAPTVAAATVLGVPLPWVLLGAAVYPFLGGVGWAYVRLAVRNEADFAAVLRRRDRAP
ncbi:MAG TPA: hypothetical protein VNV66_00455 [Pilimelia sp.]|nr:hypothetical protein [Pilimelia sp.]